MSCSFFSHETTNLNPNLSCFACLLTDLLLLSSHMVFVVLCVDDILFFQPAKVTAHWHKGTTYMVKFDDAVVARDKQLEDR